MIRLTRLNNQPLAVNSDLVKFIEQAPDTVLTLVTGEKIVVRETAQEVLDKIVEFRRSISREAFVVHEKHAECEEADRSATDPEENIRG